MYRLATHIGLFLAVMAAPSLLAASSDYSVLDTTRAGRQLYREAVNECSVAMLTQAGSRLSGCYYTLVSDEELGEAFEPFLAKTAWLTGWSYFRRHEMDPRPALLDSAAMWFARVARTRDSSLSPAAAYLRGECGWRWIQTETWKALCSSAGRLSISDLRSILDHVELTTNRFDSCLRLSAEPSLLTDAAGLRKADMLYLSAWLQRAAHRDSVAVSRIDSSVIPSLDRVLMNLVEPESELRSVVDYRRGWCDLALSLWPVDNSGSGSDLQGWADYPGPDRPLRQGMASQLVGEYVGAATLFGQAAEQNLVEGHYWRGTAYLIAATSRHALDQARLTTLEALRRSRQSYSAFLTTEFSPGDFRLLQLAALCRHRLLLLQVALGENVTFERMRTLGREDLRFLVRIMVNTLEPQRSRALSNLSDYLKEALQYPQALSEMPITDGECLVGSPEPLTADETQFYLGLTQALYAQGKFGDERIHAFRQAAATLGEVGGRYRTEAMYMRARCLFSGREFDLAEPLLVRLVSEHRSTRAAYWYVANYARSEDLSAADSQHVRHVLRAVINAVEEAGTPSEYTSTLRNAEALLGRFDNDPGVAPSRELEGLDLLICPESLAVDSVGAWPQRVFYETLYERELIERQFVRLGREELSILGPPPRVLFPTDKTCEDEARYFIISPPPAPDSIEFDDKWVARVRLASKLTDGLLGQIDSCMARNMTAGEMMNCRWNSEDSRYYLEPKATVNDVIEVKAFQAGHYPRMLTMTSDRAGGFKDTIVALAEHSTYARAGELRLGEIETGWVEARGRNAVLSPVGQLFYSEIQSALGEQPSMRDVCYDPTGQRWLGISMDSGRNLISFEGTPQSLPLSLTRSLSSPEGLAVLPDRRILVTDWGNHRVVMIDRNGHQVAEFGTWERPRDPESPGSGRLVFPTRIEVLHDTEGIEVEGRKYPRPIHLLVVDRYGIHRFDSEGRYLETAVKAESGDFGAWYDLRVDGYGTGSRLHIVDLPGNRLIEFRARH